jgi:hypothetical protein
VNCQQACCNLPQVAVGSHKCEIHACKINPAAASVEGSHSLLGEFHALKNSRRALGRVCGDVCCIFATNRRGAGEYISTLNRVNRPLGSLAMDLWNRSTDKGGNSKVKIENVC